MNALVLRSYLIYNIVSSELRLFLHQFYNCAPMCTNGLPLRYRAETLRENKAIQQGNIYYAQCGEKSAGGLFREFYVIINVLGWCSTVFLFHIVL